MQGLKSRVFESHQAEGRAIEDLDLIEPYPDQPAGQSRRTVSTKISPPYL